MNTKQTTYFNERLLHTQEARGSSPCAPTKINSKQVNDLLGKTGPQTGPSAEDQNSPFDPQSTHFSDFSDTDSDTCHAVLGKGAQNQPRKSDGIGKWLEWQRNRIRRRPQKVDKPNPKLRAAKRALRRKREVERKHDQALALLERKRHERTKIEVLGGVALVPLTGGRFATIDACDIHLISHCIWRLSGKDQRFYAVTGSRTSIGIHRVIAGAKKGETVDHWDGDGLNNRRLNLRKCTGAQNCANSQKSKRGKTSQLKGVCRIDKGWRAQIMHQYKKYNLGNFATEEAAALAYDEAARRLFGEFARCNFPRSHKGVLTPGGAV